MVDVALAKDSVDNVLDHGLRTLRDSLTSAMSANKPFLINLGMLNPDFHEVYTHYRYFPAAKIFDRNQLLSPKNFTYRIEMKIEWMVTNVTPDRSPDRAERAI